MVPVEKAGRFSDAGNGRPVQPQLPGSERLSLRTGIATSCLSLPPFVPKTWTMINDCDRAICEWTEDGTTFVVKDIEIFAAEIIPQYFKHSNFSSFVRQLNFYGFRKVKKESIRISAAQELEDAKNWRFRHEFFQRGKPSLLKKIKKASHTAADQAEVDSLKKEVTELRSQLTDMSETVGRLTSLVEAALIDGIDGGALRPAHPGDPPTKRRRLSIGSMEGAEGDAPITPTMVEPAVSVTVKEEDEGTEWNSNSVLPLKPLDKGRDFSFSSFASIDQSLANGVVDDYLYDLDEIMNGTTDVQPQHMQELAAVPDDVFSHHTSST